MRGNSIKIIRYIVKPLSSEGFALYLKYRRKEYNMETITVYTDKELKEAIEKYGDTRKIVSKIPNKDNNPELARIKYEYVEDNPETITGQ